MRLFLGVDGGQSSTAALIGDESGKVLGSGVGGPCNHVGTAEGRDKLTRAVGDSVALASRAAGLNPQGFEFEAACFGMSGGPADKQALLLRILRSKKLIVTTDALIALSGAIAGAPGIIVIAGTGSIAFGRNAAGKTARAGGWGYVFGDEAAVSTLPARLCGRPCGTRKDGGLAPPCIAHCSMPRAHRTPTIWCTACIRRTGPGRAWPRSPSS